MKAYLIRYVYRSWTGSGPDETRELVEVFGQDTSPESAAEQAADVARRVSRELFIRCDVLREATNAEAAQFRRDANRLNRAVERSERRRETKTGTNTVL